MRKNSVVSSLANSTNSLSPAPSNESSSAMAFFGTSVFNSPETSRGVLARSIWASRWPSVATMTIESGFSSNSAPFRV